MPKPVWKGERNVAGTHLGIDLGTAKVTIYKEGAGIVLREPSVIAVETRRGRVIAVGREAEEMIGREPPTIRVIRPMQKGVVSDYDCTEKMLRAFVNKVCAFKVFKPRAAISVPAAVTEVEERSVVQAATSVGIRRVALVEEYIAAAFGAGLAVEEPRGCMIVDIGAGTTDVGVLSLGGVTAAHSVKTAGNDMDEAIVRMVRSRYNHVIGAKTAEEIKKTIGGVLPREATMEVRGRDAISGLPCTKTVSASDVFDALSESFSVILNTIQTVLEQTPPEMAGDVMADGITLSGGGAHLYGLCDRLSRELGVSCRLAENAEDCVALGAGKAILSRRSAKENLYDVNLFSYDRSDWIES